MTNERNTTEARQGFRGRHILIVLIVSLGLALLVWAGVALFGESTDPESSDPATSETGLDATDVDASKPPSSVNTGEDAPEGSENEEQPDNVGEQQ